jgi:hypothetical protein
MRTYTQESTAHVTSFNTEHSHQLNPFVFAHRFLDLATKSTILAMSQTGCPPGRIAIWIRKHKGITLSTQQVRNLVYFRDAERNQHIETVELENYMSSINGKSFVMEDEREEKTVRTAIATFTQGELENLAEFGDLVAIDPTFTPCNGNHDAKHCPYRDDLKQFIRPHDGKPGGKECSACHLKGHYISRCPAIRRFRKSLGEESDSESEIASDPSEAEISSAYSDDSTIA